MFAPPPIQLTKAQIETAKLELRARAEAKAKEEEEKKEQTKENDKRNESPASSKSKTIDSPSPAKRKYGIFARNGKTKVSSPAAQRECESSTDEQRLSPHVTPSPKALPKVANVREEKGDDDEGNTDMITFGEQPRRAPVPPRSRGRPPSELFLPHVPKANPVQQPLRISHLEPCGPLPALPTDAEHTKRQSDATTAGKKSSIDPTDLGAALANLAVNEDGRTGGPRRPSGTRSLKAKQDGIATPYAESAPEAAARSTSDGQGMRQLPNIQGLTVTKGSATVPARLHTPSPIRKPPEVPKPATQGETLSPLRDAGFFPDRGALSRSSVPVLNTSIKTSTLLSYLNKDLPSTPDSITSTPTELYQKLSPRLPKPTVKTRKSKKAKRSPLSQISTNPKAAAPRKRSRVEEVSPSRLSAIPELSGTNENSPHGSGVTTPTATQIHLRGGSVLTVTPPEMTPWERHIYLQGPIKLPKPVIMPRKNSVASLDPFQEMVDQLYQGALAIPRRKSDDAVIDDICDWVDGFGFDEIDFAGDRFLIDDWDIDDIQEVEEMSADGDRFSTPPAELDVSPIDKIVAEEVIEMSLLLASAPPVDNQESLRARGIAHISKPGQGRKESMTIPPIGSEVLLTPMPEESMLEGVPEARRGETIGLAVGAGFVGGEDVDEMDAQPSWAPLALLPKKSPVKKARKV